MNILISSIAASIHLILGYFLYSSGFLFPGQGNPVISLLLVPFVSFSAAHSTPISILQFALLFGAYLLLIRELRGSHIIKYRSILLGLLIPVINIVCFGILVLS